MPIWAWIFGLACIAYSGFVLWRAWAKGFVKYGPIRYTRQGDPIYFWFVVILFGMCGFWFGGMLILVTISLINGPLVDQRDCLSTHGWRAALNCPSSPSG